MSDEIQQWIGRSTTKLMANPIGDVISLLQIEVVGVGRRRDAGWCRSELQCMSVEQIHHGCRGMEMLQRRRRELGLAIWKQSEECATRAIIRPEGVLREKVFSRT
ncbi:hypothetical protein TRIUR3_15662 [Triticum urartu]|uniref:Uncharacterized protein n=1 Tax=Triticum urartu TaxID=4572 RepID=M7ZR05_TRIUA|nr:hypothetical protein TRIUR3_15662 [Triticum urartu]